MENTRKFLLAQFVGMLAVALAMVALFETETLEPGALAGEKALEFYVMTVMELLTLGAIYMALRLFRFGRVRADLLARREAALRQWGTLRLAVLGLPLLANTLLYYMTLSATFGNLAIITLLATPFVYPSANRCLSEVEAEAEEQ